MRGSTRSCASGRRLSAASAIVSGCARSVVGPEEQDGELHRAVGVEQVRVGAARPAARRLGPGAHAITTEVHVRMADEVVHAGSAGGGEAVAAARAQRERGGAREGAVAAGDDRRADRDPARPLDAGAARARVHRVRQQHELRGRHPLLGDRPQRELRADAVAGDQRARPARVGEEAREHVGQPLRRVRVARTVLGVAVQRQVRQHDAVAVRERLDHRLELAVGQPLRMQERERRPRPGLPIRDPRAVRVVVQPQLHRARQLPT